MKTGILLRAIFAVVLLAGALPFAASVEAATINYLSQQRDVTVTATLPAGTVINESAADFGAFDAEVTHGCSGVYADVMCAGALQQSVLTADSISAYTKAGDSLRWDSYGNDFFGAQASSSFDVSFTLAEATLFNVSGLYYKDKDLETAGSAVASVVLREAAAGIIDMGFAPWAYPNPLSSYTPPANPLMGYPCLYSGCRLGLPMRLDTTLLLQAGTYNLTVQANADTTYAFGAGGYEASAYFQMSAVPVPVPPALLLFPSALAVLGWCRRKAVVAR